MTEIARPALTFAYFPPVPTFELFSHDVADGAELAHAQVANAMGYDGGNLSPQLTWSGAPAMTESYAITMHDPDAPTGSGFWHWVVANIPAHVNSLPSNAASALPEGALQVRNDAGFAGYLGAAPPPGTGTHRYVITVHAVDVVALNIDSAVAPAIVGFNLRFHAIGRAQIVAHYGI